MNSVERRHTPAVHESTAVAVAVGSTKKKVVCSGSAARQETAERVDGSECSPVVSVGGDPAVVASAVVVSVSNLRSTSSSFASTLDWTVIHRAWSA